MDLPQTFQKENIKCSFKLSLLRIMAQKYNQCIFGLLAYMRFSLNVYIIYST